MTWLHAVKFPKIDRENKDEGHGRLAELNGELYVIMCVRILASRSSRLFQVTFRGGRTANSEHNLPWYTVQLR